MKYVTSLTNFSMCLDIVCSNHDCAGLLVKLVKHRNHPGRRGQDGGVQSLVIPEVNAGGEAEAFTKDEDEKEEEEQALTELWDVSIDARTCGLLVELDAIQLFEVSTFVWYH